MIDLTVHMIREMVGKNMTTREVCVKGLIAGLAVQVELVMAGRVFYDGAFVSTLKLSAEKRISDLSATLGIFNGKPLPEALFVGWNDKKGMETEYFTYFGMGMVFVCKLYEELTTANIGWPEIMAKVSAIVDSRSAELRKMI
jgi:hypothetical protein